MSKNTGENSPADPKISAEGGAGGAPDTRAEIPLQPRGPVGNRDPPAAHGGSHARAAGCPTEAVTPWEEHNGSGSWQDPMERGAHAGAGLLAGLVTPWGTHTAAACS